MWCPPAAVSHLHRGLGGSDCDLKPPPKRQCRPVAVQKQRPAEAAAVPEWPGNHESRSRCEQHPPPAQAEQLQPTEQVGTQLRSGHDQIITPKLVEARRPHLLHLKNRREIGLAVVVLDSASNADWYCRSVRTPSRMHRMSHVRRFRVASGRQPRKFLIAQATPHTP
jgi:hypothetical protein